VRAGHCDSGQAPNSSTARTQAAARRRHPLLSRPAARQLLINAAEGRQRIILGWRGKRAGLDIAQAQHAAGSS
jgi:hypothetical protein